MPLNVIGNDPETGSCVYKLFCGKKYVVVKGNNLAGSVFLIEKGYAAFLAAGGGSGKKKGGIGQKESDGVNTYYFKFYKHLKSNPTLPLQVEVIFESDNAYQLLKREQIELTKAFKDKNLLNNNITSYIPKYRSEKKMYGWIPRMSVLNFKKFLKNM